MRPDGRDPEQLRKIVIENKFLLHAEGSALISYGDTKVLCTASIEKGVPRFLRDSKQGWITAEYGMLPRSTHSRMDREAARGKQSGRTVEIQRLIGRSIRAAVDLEKLSDCTIKLDCDVIQADGGTRTAAITGAWIALRDALNQHFKGDKTRLNACLIEQIAAVSVGIYKGEVIIDLNYTEDSAAETDMNIVMNANRGFIEIQGTAEHKSFNGEQLQAMQNYAMQAIVKLHDKQAQTSLPNI